MDGIGKIREVLAAAFNRHKPKDDDRRQQREHAASPPKKHDPLDEIAPFRDENGAYIFRLDVIRDYDSLSVHSPDMRGFHGTFRDGRDGKACNLANIRSIAESVRFSASMNFDLGHVDVWFRDPANGRTVSGEDEILGLKPGRYELIVVPGDVDWKPAAQPAMKAPKNTCPVRKPAF